MKKYRTQQKEEASQIAVYEKPPPPVEHSSASIGAAVQAAQLNAQNELERLPDQIIRHTTTFHDELRYFVHKDDQALDHDDGRPMDQRPHTPQVLKGLLDEISQLESIGERAKREILDDPDARNVRPPILTITSDTDTPS